MDPESLRAAFGRNGGRFEIAAQEKDGAIAWTCRPIDLALEMLPFSCRPPAPNPR